MNMLSKDTIETFASTMFDYKIFTENPKTVIYIGIILFLLFFSLGVYTFFKNREKIRKEDLFFDFILFCFYSFVSLLISFATAIIFETSYNKKYEDLNVNSFKTFESRLDTLQKNELNQYVAECLIRKDLILNKDKIVMFYQNRDNLSDKIYWGKNEVYICLNKYLN